MPKARALVPLTHPETGEPIAPGAVVELGDDFYRDLRANGAIEASEEEVAEHRTPDAEGNYGARTGREDAGGRVAEEPVRKPVDEAPSRQEKKR